MEFENAFSKPEKVVDFRENGRGRGKAVLTHGICFFSPNISCRLKTGNMLLVINPKYTPQIAGFSAFLSHGKT